MKLILIPFVYNKDCTKIKTLYDLQARWINFNGEKATEKDVCNYFACNLCVYNAEILRSGQLYSAYLKLTPKIFLSAAEKELITKTKPRNVRAFVIRDKFETDLYSVEDILELGTKFKKAFIKYTKQEAKKAEQEKKQQELKEKELVEDTREF